MENPHDIKKAARLLGRTEGACYKQLQRLGFSKIRQRKKLIVMVFPRQQIDLRRAIVEQVLPRLKKLLDKIDKADDLAPESINDLAKIVRAAGLRKTSTSPVSNYILMRYLSVLGPLVLWELTHAFELTRLFV